MVASPARPISTTIDGRGAKAASAITAAQSTAVIRNATLQQGEIQMPTKVNVELIVVWACVGFFTGAGWALATWLVGRILGLTHL
jgi:hypothetical protein